MTMERTLYEVTWQHPDSDRLYKMKVMAETTDDALRIAQDVVKLGAFRWSARQLIDFDHRPIGDSKRIINRIAPSKIAPRRMLTIVMVGLINIIFLAVVAILFDGPVLFYRNVIRPIFGGLSEKTKLG